MTGWSKVCTTQRLSLFRSLVAVRTLSKDFLVWTFVFRAICRKRGRNAACNHRRYPAAKYFASPFALPLLAFVSPCPACLVGVDSQWPPRSSCKTCFSTRRLPFSRRAGLMLYHSFDPQSEPKYVIGAPSQHARPSHNESTQDMSPCVSLPLLQLHRYTYAEYSRNLVCRVEWYVVAREETKARAKAVTEDSDQLQDYFLNFFHRPSKTMNSYFTLQELGKKRGILTK
jgi:hypothetical protein